MCGDGERVLTFCLVKLEIKLVGTNISWIRNQSLLGNRGWFAMATMMWYDKIIPLPQFLSLLTCVFFVVTLVVVSWASRIYKQILHARYFRSFFLCFFLFYVCHSAVKEKSTTSDCRMKFWQNFAGFTFQTSKQQTPPFAEQKVNTTANTHVVSRHEFIINQQVQQENYFFSFDVGPSMLLLLYCMSLVVVSVTEFNWDMQRLLCNLIF